MEMSVKVRLNGQNFSAHISLGALPSCIPLEITPVNIQTPQVQPDSQVQNNSETWMDGWMDDRKV